MPKATRCLPTRSVFYRKVNSRAQEIMNNVTETLHNQSLELISTNFSSNIAILSPNLDSTENNLEENIRTEHNPNENVLPYPEYHSPSISNNGGNNNFTNPSNNVCQIFTDIRVSNEINLDITSQLRSWAIENNITGLALRNLLSIVKLYYNSLPLDPRTLLNTPRKIDIKYIEPGFYYHMGIEKGLYFLLKNSSGTCKNSVCEVLINIDGLPISKSSSSQLYPILMSLFPHNNIVTTIGLYHGVEKPNSSNTFLRDFVNEAKHLTINGFTFKNKYFQFKIKGFVCDAPAKSFVKCIKGHTGYFSCSKCHQEGQFTNNKMFFPDIDFTLRTDDDFLNLVDEEHHTGNTILQEIPYLGLVSSFPLDYMHLHCLGVMKKLLVSIWIKGKPPVKLRSQKILQISEKLLMQSKNIPNEFCRKPRGLQEANRWKATELRQFLLYSGIVVLYSVIPKKYYDNFLALHLSTFILCNPKSNETQLDYAHSLLIYFVKSFKILYGQENMSHNVHNLLHVVDDVRLFGCLDNYSAFPFENYLQVLGNLIRKPGKPVQQIVNRLFEAEYANKNVLGCKAKRYGAHKPHDKGPLTVNSFSPQFLEYYFSDFILKSSPPNNCCGLKNGTIVLIENIATGSDSIVIIGKRFKNIENFFINPCPSLHFKIFKVFNLDSELQCWSIKDLDVKFVKLDLYENSFVVLPLLHSEQ